MYLEIKYAGQLLDFQVTPEKFYFSYSIKSLEDFTKVGGSLTERSISIPATRRNNSVLSSYWDNTLNNFDAANFQTITISDGGQFVFEGKALIKEVELYGNHYGLSGKFYKIACFANNSDFIIGLQNKLMNELSIIDTIDNLVYDDATIKAGFIFSTNIFCTGLIKYGNWVQPDRVSIFDFTFCLFIKPLLISVFNDLGYIVESDFLDTEEAGRYCMPLIPLSEIGQEQNYELGGFIASDTQGVLGGLGNFPLDYNTIDQGNNLGAYDTTTGVYTAQLNGTYFFKLVIRASLNNVAPGIQVSLRKNNVLPFADFKTFNPQTDNVFETFEMIFGIDLLKNDTVDFIISAQTSNISYEMISYECQVSNILPQDGLPLLPKILLRDYKQADFIAGVQHMFNLNIEANSFSRIVKIEPADNYITSSQIDTSIETGFYNNTEPKDIDLLPTSRLFNESAKYQKQIEYRFKVNDPTSQALDKDRSIGYCDGVYNFNANRFKEGQKVSENPFFYKTPVLVDAQIKAAISQNTPVMPLVWPENYLEDKSPAISYNNVVPRIFYFKEISGFLGTENVANVGLTVLNIPQLLTIDINDPNSGILPVSYGNQTVNGVEYNGFIRRYYLPELKRQQVGKLLETWVFWRNLDVSNLTFRNKLFVDGSLYILQDIINFDPLTSGSTKTRLLLDIPVEADDINNINSSDVNPVIIAE